MPPISGCGSVSPGGPNSGHTMFTVTGTSTAGFNSTCMVQFRVTVDPTGRIGLGVLLDNVTEVGAGTGWDKINGDCM